MKIYSKNGRKIEVKMKDVQILDESEYHSERYSGNINRIIDLYRNQSIIMKIV